MVIGLMNGVGNRWLRAIPLVALGLLCARTQWDYVERSCGEPGRTSGAFVEIRGASSSRITREIENLVRGGNHGRLVIDTSNIVLAKLQCHFLRGYQVSFPFWDLYQPVGKKPIIVQAPELKDAQSLLSEAWKESRRSGEFSFGGKATAAEVSEFSMEPGGQPGAGEAAQYAVVVNTSLQSLMNRRKSTDERSNFHLLPGERNQLHKLLSNACSSSEDVAETADDHPRLKTLLGPPAALERTEEGLAEVY